MTSTPSLRLAVACLAVASFATSIARAQASDAAVAAAGMAIELDRTADARRWLAAVPEPERGWAWRLASGLADRSLGVVAELGQPIVASSLSGDGSRFAIAAVRGEIRVYDTATLEEASRVDTEGVSTRSIALSPKGDHLVAAGGDGRIRVWNLARRRLVLQWPGNSDELSKVAWSLDGRMIAAGGFVRDATSGRPKGSLTVYSPVGLELRTLEPKAFFVSALAFSPDSKLLAAGGAQGNLDLFDTAGAEPPRRLQLEQVGGPPQVDGLAFSPDGTRFAAACGDGTVRVWESATGRTLAGLSRGPGAHRSGVNAIVFAAGGSRVVSAGADLTLRAWDPARSEPLAVLHGHTAALIGVASTPGGELLTASEDGSVRRWSLASSEIALDHGGASVWDENVDPSGALVATAAEDGKVRIWEVATGALRREIAAHEKDAVQAIFSSDGVRLATSGNDGKLRLWNPSTGERIAELAALERGRFSAFARAERGTLFAAGTSVGTVQLRDFATGELLRVLSGHTGEVDGIDFSADGTKLVTAAADGNAIVWDTASGNQIKSIHAHDAEIHALALSPDGRRLATGSSDRAIRIWDVASGDRLAELRGHTERVWDVDWSPDGKLLASASNDFSARIWNAESGAPLVALGFPLQVYLSRWSKDGETLFVAPFDGRVRLHRPAPEKKTPSGT